MNCASECQSVYNKLPALGLVFAVCRGKMVPVPDRTWWLERVASYEGQASSTLLMGASFQAL
jgi:hypothetical protein